MDINTLYNMIKENHELHEKNRDKISDIDNKVSTILNEVTNVKKAVEFQNGRVRKLEDTIVDHDKIMTSLIEQSKDLYKIVSNQNNQYEKWVSQQEKIHDKTNGEKADKKDVEEIKDTIKWVTRLIIGTVILAWLSLIIIKVQ